MTTETDTNSAATGDMLLSFVERIEAMNQEITDRNSDKRDLYGEAKATGLDPKIIKAIVARRAKDPDEVKEGDLLIETYMTAIEQAELRKSSGRHRSHSTASQRASATA